MALGWCYKRTHRLAQAIDALERALQHARQDPRHNREDPLLHYNLACYWSLAGNVSKALDSLSAALDLEPGLRALVPKETDFDQLRGNPDFERLTVGPSPLA